MSQHPSGVLALDDWIARSRGSIAAAFVRRPAFDDDPRAGAGDLDLLVFDDDADELWPQREASSPGPTLDLLRAPSTWLLDARRLAGMGLIAHRLMASRLAFDRDGRGESAQSELADLAWSPGPQRERLGSLLDMGWLTVREVGVTWDWPALARFWLHMAQAAALATMLDSLRLPCPNIYTRAPAWARRLHAAGGPELAPTMVSVLGLDDDHGSAASALRALHAGVVHNTDDEPDWPQAMRRSTRLEYRYWRSRRELNERLDAAAALRRAGDGATALFYLRYTAYSLLRVAMLHQRAREGWPRHVPFIRPEVELLQDLQAHHPGLLPLAQEVFGDCDHAALDAALAATSMLQGLALDVVRAQGLAPPDTRPWMPHRPRPANGLAYPPSR